MTGQCGTAHYHRFIVQAQQHKTAATAFCDCRGNLYMLHRSALRHECLTDFLRYGVPLAFSVKQNGNYRRHRPADGPGAPDARGTKRRPGQHEGQHHPQNQVGKGRRHELTHFSCSPENAVRHQLGGDHKVEGGQYPQKPHSAAQRCLRGVLHEEVHQRPAAGAVQCCQWQADQPYHFQRRPEALLNPRQLARAQILGSIVGNAVADGGKRGDDQIVQLHRSGIARHNVRAEAVNDALDQDIAHGDEALLQNAGDGDDHEPPQQLPGKQYHLPLAGQLLQPADDHGHRQHAADALAQEGRPGHACHAHFEGRDKQNVHGDVAQGGHRQEDKGRPAVSQGGENARGNVIEKYEGQTPDVDIQIQRRVGEHFLRGVDQRQQAVAAENAHQHQQQANHAAGQRGGGHGGLYIAIFPRAEQLGYQHGAADVAAEGEGNEDQGDLIAVAHGGEGILPDKFPRHPAVGNVVKLLKHDAAEQGQTEFPENR